jgi:hypothetical protein
MSSDNYGGLARLCLFFLILELFFGTELPTALHLLLTWGLSGLLLLAILRRTECGDDREERAARRKWAIGFLLTPILFLSIGFVLPSPWGNVFAGAAGGALVTPGFFPGLVLLLFSLATRGNQLAATSFTKQIPRASVNIPELGDSANPRRDP